MAKQGSFFGNSFGLLKQTFNEWLEDKAPQLGAALAYYTVFSLAPLILLLLAIVGVLFRSDPSGAWTRITEQMGYFLDHSALEVVQQIAQKAAQPNKSSVATIIGIALALFGASGVFGQLQDALNTIWGVKAKPGLGIRGFLRSRFLSFAMVGGVCFLLLVSLVIEGLLKGFSHYVQTHLPGGLTFALSIYLIFDACIVVLVFAMIFKFLPDVKLRWSDVWVGAIDLNRAIIAGAAFRRTRPCASVHSRVLPAVAVAVAVGGHREHGGRSDLLCHRFCFSFGQRLFVMFFGDQHVERRDDEQSE